MLKDTFYKIVDFKKEGNSVHTTLKLNEQHVIFKGHFENQPVVPGVCLIQITKEILSYSLNKKLQITQADDIKFLQMINPKESSLLEIKITYSFESEEMIDANIIFFKEQQICGKIRSKLKDISKF